MEVKGEKLEIGYDGRIVVREMDITVKKGEITTIIGPNGSGKSTLLKALTRLLRCSMGCVYLNQEDLYNIDSKKLAKCIGVLPQRHCAPPDFKVRDLVGYGRVPYQKWYEQNTEEDEKIIAIPVNDPYLNNYKNITELPTQLLDEIMHFFEVYKQLERKQTSVDKMLGRDEAEAIVEKCINNYKEKFER
mgnify:CR=1 FL=1